MLTLFGKDGSTFFVEQQLGKFFFVFLKNSIFYLYLFPEVPEGGLPDGP